MLKKLVIAFYVLVFIFGVRDAYAQAANSGFVPGSIWYSEDPFEEGDKIKIYTFIFNSYDRELRGTVSFYDKDTLLGKKDFKLASQTADDVSVNWTVTVGSHSIYAKIENPEFLTSKGTYEDAELKDTQTRSSVRTVSKKVIVNKGEEVKEGAGSQTVSSTSLQGIQNTIEKNTPAFISKPIITFTNSLEGSRSLMQAAGEEKKISTKEDLARLDSKSETENDNIFLKPFKYLELFAVTLFTFIVSTHIIFYIALVLAIFFIIRWIWRRFF